MSGIDSPRTGSSAAFWLYKRSSDYAAQMNGKSSKRIALAALASAFGLPSTALGKGDANHARQAIEDARRQLALFTETADESSVHKAEPSAARTRARRPERRAAGQSWHRDLTMPDMPVVWSQQLVELLDFYKTDPKGRELMAAWQLRAGRYGDMVFRKLQKAGMPQALYYVAMVESGFNPQVRSEAGAVGMWQFVASTAREHGLMVNDIADQRLSPEDSTDAALDFLESLHSRTGSWALTLAAYNMGFGALSKSVRKYNTNDFLRLSQMEAGLPYETINYVAKVTACAIVAKNLHAFGIDPGALESPVSTATVLVPGGIPVGRVAQAAGLTVDALAALNPELKQRRIPTDVAQWKVHIPLGSLRRFKRKWPILRPRSSSFRVHIVKMGEPLANVAAMYGTSLERLLSLNNHSKNDEVPPGTALRVPNIDPVTSDPKTTAMIAVPQDIAPPANHRRVFYRVNRGDALAQIAGALGVPEKNLSAWNHLDPGAVLFDGMYLQAFVPKYKKLGPIAVLTEQQVHTIEAGTQAFYDAYEARNNRRRIRYRVQPGDTLNHISKRFGLSVGSIARINRFSRYRAPTPNTEIVLYVDKHLTR